MQSTAKSSENEVIEAEKQYWRAVRDKDASVALRLTDDSCLVAGPQGAMRVERERLAKMMENPSCVVRRFELAEPLVNMVSNDVAVIAYKVHEQVEVDGKTMTLDAVDASTWVRRDGKWLCALHTESLAGDPYGRERSERSARK